MALTPATCRSRPRWEAQARASLRQAIFDNDLATMPGSPSREAVRADRYYAALVLLAPAVILAEWLIAGALTHVILRLANRRSDMDRILGISGFTMLSVGAVIVVAR